jgi:hypothetical protein
MPEGIANLDAGVLAFAIFRTSHVERDDFRHFAGFFFGFEIAAVKVIGTRRSAYDIEEETCHGRSFGLWLAGENATGNLLAAAEPERLYFTDRPIPANCGFYAYNPISGQVGRAVRPPNRAATCALAPEVPGFAIYAMMP